MTLQIVRLIVVNKLKTDFPKIYQNSNQKENEIVLNFKLVKEILGVKKDFIKKNTHFPHLQKRLMLTGPVKETLKEVAKVTSKKLVLKQSKRLDMKPEKMFLHG